MAGNAEEWCMDDYYPHSPYLGITDINLSLEKTVKGGGWNKGIDFLNCKARRGKWSRIGTVGIGFRVVWDYKEKNGGNNLIKCVIFDLDDTLCDYKGAMENAKQSVNIHLKKANIDTCIFWKIYHELEPSLFKKFTEKKITKDMYRLKRYSDVLEILSVKNTELSLKLNDIYMKKANNEINLFEDVVPLLEKLKEQNIDTALLTNGPVDGQRQK